MPQSGKSIPSEALETLTLETIKLTATLRNAKSVISHSVFSPVSNVKSIASSVVPKSLSGVDMLKFGKIIKAAEKKVLNFGVEEFDVESKEWVVLGPVLFLTENAPFGEGGSRYAFKASSKYRKFRDATYVI